MNEILFSFSAIYELTPHLPLSPLKHLNTFLQLQLNFESKRNP